jgi:hypothetical protein
MSKSMLRPPRRPAPAPAAAAPLLSWPLRIGLAAGAGVLALALFPLLSPERAPRLAGETLIRLGEISLRVDPAFLLRPEDQRGGPMAEALLGFDARSLGPPEPARPLAPGLAHANPDLVRLTLTARDAKLSPTERTERLYMRHLEPDSEASVAGLSLRRFAPGSPYEQEDLHFTPPDGALFAARCERTRAGTRGDETHTPVCIADLRVEGLDARLEFKLRWLEDWETLARVAREAASAAMAAGAKQPDQKPKPKP